MAEGDLEVRGTVPGFFIFGMSWQHLWWRDGQRKVKLIGSGGRAPASRCEACGLVIFRSVAG